jgi:septum formation protein
MKKIILASGSPRRKMLMEWAEFSFDVLVSDADESYDPEDSPDNIARSIAEKKIQAVLDLSQIDLSDSIIVAADTIVVLDGEIIGKPVDRADALGILKRLAGKKHQVITAVCIQDDKQKKVFHDTTHVSFHALSEEQIIHYVDNYKPYDKAGAYAIQEWIGVIGIQCIEGDFYNVMGLPVSRLVHTLKESFL